MNPTIHVRGSLESRNSVHLSITRNGLPESLLTRRELRSLARVLSEEINLISRVLPGSDFSLEIYLSSQERAAGE